MVTHKLARIRLPLLALLAVTHLAGCGGGAGLVPVEGRVTLDGNPFEKVKVLFYLPGGGPETNYTAITDADGRFSLTSLDGEQSGVAPGSYSVSLTTNHWAPDALETDPPPRELVSPHNRDHKFEVPAEGTNEANFDLSSK
ncbi:carboxypeptidase-like regulatory domain-containing protein [Adhaeretor mobilis]|uniref:Carboxypeptidase regulatory-like domain-containing protein n=1 Tax=Adhaeretor mobilis TaxID=1930276 RepID=A0A517N187_9BACT|nr:carboxypeptidase-like regulatory domain-containing protein [Adhaeretor mobilis]QDT00896.1 hypothetical protein HG15A2_42380 [Adhaeretor mobilis]